MSTGALSDSESQHSYFIPMVDMLAGVVFILVILLAATTLVSRSDFADAAAANAEIRRINAALKLARVQEHNVLEPRRRARAAQRRLLDQISARLNAASIPNVIDYEAGSLSIPANQLFSPERALLDDSGRRCAAELSAIFNSELPCLSKPPAPAENCAPYEGVILDEAVVAYRPATPPVDSVAALPSARALSLLSQVVITAPRLAGLAAADAGKLLTHASFAPLAAKDQPDSKNQSSAAPHDAIVLQFHMQTPPPK